LLHIFDDAVDVTAVAVVAAAAAATVMGVWVWVGVGGQVYACVPTQVHCMPTK